MNDKRFEVFVFTSNNCNLGCSYCSVLSSSQRKFPVVPQYSMEDLFAFVKQVSEEKEILLFDIYFFGGEPTLNKVFIEDFICRAKQEENLRFRFILHTNGILLNTINDFILDNLASIIVSINYEKIPNTNLEGSYFGRIIDNVRMTKQKKELPLLARLTITENVSLYNNVIQVASFFDSIYWQIMNCESFNNFQKFYTNYEYELNLLWDYWHYYLQKGVILNLIPFIAPFTLDNYLTNYSNHYLCGFDNNMIYVQTDGTCYSCAEEILDSEYFKVGDIHAGFSFKKKRTEFADDNCMICRDYPYCKGRCGRMQERFDVEHIKEYCLLNKVLFNQVSSKKDLLRSDVHFMNYVKTQDLLTIKMTEYLP